MPSSPRSNGSTARSKKIGALNVVNGLPPDLDALCLLDHEVDFDSVVADGQQIAVIAEIEELLALARPFTGQVVALVVAVEMHFVGQSHLPGAP